MVTPSKLREAQIWLDEEYEKYFKIFGEIKYETSVPEIQKDSKEHNEKIEKEMAAKLKELSVEIKGRRCSKVVAN